MAIITPRWYESSALKWQKSYRNLFTIHKTSYNLDHDESDFIPSLIKELEYFDKLPWLKNNNMSFDSLKIVGEVDYVPWQLRVLVLIDLPAELHTMYALRFTE